MAVLQWWVSKAEMDINSKTKKNDNSFLAQRIIIMAVKNDNSYQFALFCYFKFSTKCFSF